MREADELAAAAASLSGLEIVPGVPAEPPAFGPAWGKDEVSALRTLVGGVPETYAALMLEVGAISAIEAAGGFVTLNYEEVRHHMSLDYGSALTSIVADGSPKSVFPIGTNSSGSYFLLATDDSGVWKYNVHMRPIAKPQRVASSATDFLSKLAEDWRAMAAGIGAPYMTD